MTALTGKHALVCGASAGIGRATAVALAAMGATVTALARRADRLEDVVSTIQRGGGQARPLVADMEDLPTLRERVDELVRTHGAVDVLVHNTGGPAGGPILVATPEALSLAFQRHVLSAQVMLQAVLPGMEKAKWGRMVLVTSTSVREPIHFLGVSNTIRAAMASWMKTVSNELPPGLTINNVMPGYTNTERLRDLAAANAERSHRTEGAVVDDWLKSVPEGRLGTAEEVAAVIAFLCSPASSFVRGVNLPVDGGRLKSL